MDRVAHVASLAIALVDMPMVFLLQWATFPTSPSASGVAGFTVGVYVLLVVLAALSLENWFIFFTAAVGTGFEVALQALAGVSAGAMASTVILLGLAAFSCAYARSRLVDLVGRIDRNLAEQRRAERALRQSERMASLGTLAAGVAHEINTPLTYVVTNLALMAERLPRRPVHETGAPLQKAMADVTDAVGHLVSRVTEQVTGKLRHDVRNWHTTVMFRLDALADQLERIEAGGGPDAPIEQLVEQARDGAERVRRIVRDLKTFSHPDEDALVPIDVRRVVESSINLVSSAIQQRACLRTDLAPAPSVLANETRLGQVFLNLLLNAAQAIPEGAAARHEVRVVTRTDEQGRAVVEIRDSGSGIPPEIMRRLFDPFVTTKPVGEGTGLGLSICHRIVTTLGGTLSVESAVGRGSTFQVVLPPAAGAASPVSAPQTIVERVVSLAPPRRARILLIDDDALIGAAVRESLREHDVVALTSAAEALSRLTGGEQFDLIMCDLMMPVMTGMDLHEALSRQAPAEAERMVFLTGGAFTPRAQTFLTEVPNARLDKPFDPSTLRRFVAISLENRGAGAERNSG